MKTIRDATSAMNERKRTLFESDDGVSLNSLEINHDKRYIGIGVRAPLDVMRQLSIGFDIDMSELKVEASVITRVATHTIAEDIEKNDGENIHRIIPSIVGSAWMDGFLCGMMLAELRRKEEEDDK